MLFLCIKRGKAENRVRLMRCLRYMLGYGSIQSDYLSKCGFNSGLEMEITNGELFLEFAENLEECGWDVQIKEKP